MKLRFKKKLFLVFFVGLYFFTLTCLYSEQHRNMYYLIVLGEFVIALGSVFFSKKKSKKIINCRFLIWLFSVFLMYASWAIIKQTYVQYSHKYIGLHLLNTLTIIMMFIDKPKEIIEDSFCKGSVIGSILSILFVVINEFDIIRQGAERIGTSASGNVDVFGMYLGVMSIFVLYKVIVKKENKYLIPYVLQVVFMLLTGSKQALLYIIISYIMFIFYSNKGDLKKYLIPFIVAIAMVIAIFNVPVLYTLVGHRIKIMLVSFGVKIGGIESSYSTNKRIDMIFTALKLFTRNPIFGGGWGYFTEFSGFNVYSHTTYTEILVTYGLFGFILYYSYFFSSTIRLALVKHRSCIEELFFVIMCSLFAGDIARITFSQTALNYVMVFLAWKIFRERKKHIMES